MLEIEHYYEIDQLEDLEIWKREYNIPPREMAPVVLESNGKRCLTAGLWSLLGPWADSLEHANRASTFNAKAETLADRPTYRNALLKRSQAGRPLGARPIHCAMQCVWEGNG